MSEGSSFRYNVSGREYDINSDFNWNSSVYLLGCKVCGKQYLVACLHPLEPGLTIISHLQGPRSSLKVGGRG